MGALVNLDGRRFGLLTVVGRAGSSKHKKAVWRCQCDCGGRREVLGAWLVNGSCISCGCRKGFITHQMSKTRLYRVWASMLARCKAPVPRYGGRGILVCERWTSFEAFVDDMGGDYVYGLQIDRINNDGNYEPGNCRWVTRTVNNRNRCTNRMVEVQGRSVTLAEAAEISGINKCTLKGRANRGICSDKTGLFAPVKRRARDAADA